jgi:hypothetical protein
MIPLPWWFNRTVGAVFVLLAALLFSYRLGGKKSQEKDLKRALDVRRNVTRSRSTGVRDDEIIYRD